MRILMLSGTYPIPPDNGAKRRVLATLNYLSQHHQLTLVSFRELASGVTLNEKIGVPWREYIINSPVKGRFHTALRSIFSKSSYGQIKYWNSNFQTVVSKLLRTGHFDCLWVHHFNMITYIDPTCCVIQAAQNRSIRILLLDQHNVDELYYGSFNIRRTNPVWRLLATLEVLKSRRLQKEWFPRFDIMLCVSPDDLQKTAEYVDTSDGLWLAPNGVDIDYFTQLAPEDRREATSMLVFGGSLDVSMNQDAAYWFSDSIFPLIKERVPDVQFLIVGRRPPPRIRNLAKRHGIIIASDVPDVRDFYRQAAVFVVPVRIGGGTKLKTLEAMAMGLPIVSTSVGAQGLDVESGRHLFISDSSESFAARVVELLNDRDKCVRMGAEARGLVERKYNWDAILTDVDRKIQTYFADRITARM